MDDRYKLLHKHERKRDEILPSDIGVSLAEGYIGDIVSCVINGINTNAIAKKDIAKYINITVVPGGTPYEPYVVPTTVKINSGIEAVTTPAIYNVTMTLADTEYSQLLPDDTKKVEFRCQDVGFDIQYAYETGKVATPTAPYGFIGAGESKTIDGLDLTNTTLYFACSNAGKVMQIECWT